MLTFYNNKQQLFTCKIVIEGANLSNAKARLVLQGKVGYLFDGVIDKSGNCRVVIPSTKFVNESGEAELEVIVDNNGFFNPYKSKYEIINREVNVSEAKMENNISVKLNEKAIVKSPTVIQSINNKKLLKNIFKENCSNKNKKLVISMLKKFQNISETHKKTILEFIDVDFLPQQKTKKWAREIFKNTKTSSVKLCMYQKELLK